nr:hypothetical protein [Tanacetum cinerariifolium]
ELLDNVNKHANKVIRLSQIIGVPHRYFCTLSSSDDKSSDRPERLQFIRATTEQVELYDGCYSSKGFATERGKHKVIGVLSGISARRLQFIRATAEQLELYDG